MAHAYLMAGRLAVMPIIFCGKTMFVNKQEARRAMAKYGMTCSSRKGGVPVAHSGERDRVMAPYKCRQCCGWHLGNQG